MLIVSKSILDKNDGKPKDRRKRSDDSFLMYKVQNMDALIRVMTDEYGEGVPEHAADGRYRSIVGDTVYSVIRE